MNLGQFIAIAVTLVALLCVVFCTIEHVSKKFDKQFGTPPKQVTEDDPGLIEYLERKLRHLED